MSIRARNMLSGEVAEITPRSVNSKVKLTLARKQEIVAVITN